MSGQYISCELRVKAACGHYIDLHYSGDRQKGLRKFILEKEAHKCNACKDIDRR